MKITVQRRWESDWSVCGEMSIDGEFFCYSLEPARDHPVHPGHPCIAAGTFDVVLTMSHRLGYVTPLLLDVPGRTAILIHPGNKPEDTLGCTLVGNEHKTDWVSNSGETFRRLMVVLQQATEIKITYIDPPKIAGWV